MVVPRKKSSALRRLPTRARLPGCDVALKAAALRRRLSAGSAGLTAAAPLFRFELVDARFQPLDQLPHLAHSLSSSALSLASAGDCAVRTLLIAEIKADPSATLRSEDLLSRFGWTMTRIFPQYPLFKLTV